MTERAYLLKCKLLFQKARDKGLELSFYPEKFDPKRLDCLWYGGHVASIKVSDELSVEVEINGDVYASLYDEDFFATIAEVKDKGNCGRFYKEMEPFIKDDKQLEKLIARGRLDIEYNNWVEYGGEVIRNGKSYFVDLGLITDNLLDNNILRAIEEVLNNIDTVVEEIKMVEATK